jgi:hypothetical protein
VTGAPASPGSFAIVSAADSGYFALLRGLVLSCRDRPRGAEVPLCVLDLGLEPEQLAWLRARGVTHRRPEWDFDFPGRDETPVTFRAQTARPFLPGYFPGYEVYLWMDADTWVQDWSAVETLASVARTGPLAIVPEVDRCYSVTFSTRHALERYASWESVFGREAAEQAGLNPTVNSGVFALRGDAPHWGMWAAALGQALQRTRSFYIEQFTLNHVIYVQQAPTYFLPARFNWITWFATPVLKRSTGLFVEPRAPFSPLGIVHLTGDVKATRVQMAHSDGSRPWQTLEYPGAAEDAPEQPSPSDSAAFARRASVACP